MIIETEDLTYKLAPQDVTDQKRWVHEVLGIRRGFFRRNKKLYRIIVVPVEREKVQSVVQKRKWWKWK